MSDIQLSPQLFSEIEAAVLKVAPDADQGVVMQYMAAFIGYTLGNQQNMPMDNKKQYLTDLSDFSEHVMDDTHQRILQQQNQQRATSQNAFGIWEPNK